MNWTFSPNGNNGIVRADGLVKKRSFSHEWCINFRIIYDWIGAHFDLKHS